MVQGQEPRTAGMVTRKALQSLAGVRAEHCVSLFMPTHRLGREVQQDPIRLKNLLSLAEDRLVQNGMRGTDARQMLNPAHGLLDDAPFWQHQGDGLAILLTPQGMRVFRVPLRLDETVAVGARFQLKPLLPLLNRTERFLVLALSQDQVRLLDCTRDSVVEVDLAEAEAPRSMAQALWTDDEEKQQQWHTNAPGFGENPPGGARYNAVYHGHGETDQTKLDLHRFFLRLDRALQDVLNGQDAPLVLAGVEYLLPIYAEVNTYSSLVEGGVTGNPEQLRPEELRDHAWPIVAPIFQEREEQVRRLYHEALSVGLASADVSQVTEAATHGRVDSLFTVRGVELWGRVDEETGRVEAVHPDYEPGDEDVLDVAAIRTFLTDGQVFALPKEQMPDDVEVAAVFRY